eukprot:scaffold2934_cov176-Amphora_coffeaeformis.AAC.15
MSSLGERLMGSTRARASVGLCPQRQRTLCFDALVWCSHLSNPPWQRRDSKRFGSKSSKSGPNKTASQNLVNKLLTFWVDVFIGLSHPCGKQIGNGAFPKVFANTSRQ